MSARNVDFRAAFNPETCRALLADLEAAERERDALREAARWIPVEEKLPEPRISVSRWRDYLELSDNRLVLYRVFNRDDFRNQELHESRCLAVDVLLALADSAQGRH
jgi:hypothetical protein